MTGPLQGIRVLDLTTMLSGPQATLILGDLGADVIKVETPEGDGIRDIGPMRNPGMGAMFLQANRNKRSIVLDLKAADGREAFLRLIATADVFVTNTRRKPLQRLGLSYEELTAINPSLIYVSIVGYGSTGPYADKPAYDDLIQAAAGIPALAGSSDPSLARYAPIAIADRVTGMHAANAALGALYHRQKTGEGQHIEIPMFETVAAMVLADHMGGLVFDPQHGAPVFQRYATTRRPFATKDGFISLMMITDKQWRAFFTEAGCPALADDPRFRDVTHRTENTGQLYAIVAELLSTGTTADWIERLEGCDIPVAKLESIESLLDNPHLKATAFFETVEHHSEGPIRSIARTSTWSLTQPGLSRGAPRLREHGSEVLAEAGYSDEQIKALLVKRSDRSKQ